MYEDDDGGVHIYQIIMMMMEGIDVLLCNFIFLRLMAIMVRVLGRVQVSSFHLIHCHRYIFISVVQIPLHL